MTKKTLTDIAKGLAIGAGMWATLCVPNLVNYHYDVRLIQEIKSLSNQPNVQYVADVFDHHSKERISTFYIPFSYEPVWFDNVDFYAIKYL